MNCTWEAAVDLKSRKLFSATAVIWMSSLATSPDEKRAMAPFFKGVHSHGHPQCRKKLVTVGFPSMAGSFSCSEDGAHAPTSATSAVGRWPGDHQKASSCLDVMLAVVQRKVRSDGVTRGKRMIRSWAILVAEQYISPVHPMFFSGILRVIPEPITSTPQPSPISRELGMQLHCSSADYAA